MWRPVADIYGQRSIRLSLLDRSGTPVKEADVKLTLFHHAHGQQIQEISLTPVADSPGTYSADASMRKAGLWEFRISAKHGNDVFQLTQQRDIP